MNLHLPAPPAWSALLPLLPSALLVIAYVTTVM